MQKPALSTQLGLFVDSAGDLAEPVQQTVACATAESAVPLSSANDSGFLPEPERQFSASMVREIEAATPEMAKELCRTALLRNVPLVQTRLVEQVPFRNEDRILVRGPGDVARVLTEYFALQDRESFVVVMLSTSGAMTAIHPVSVGGLTSSIVEPRQVFKAAILCNAAAIVLGHNHPSGSLEPSREDVAVTKQLVDAGKLLGIPVHDHLICAGRAFTSLAEKGLLHW